MSAAPDAVLEKFRRENSLVLQAFARLIDDIRREEHPPIALVAHDSADIDAMASVLALRRYFESVGVQARLYGHGIGAHAENQAFANEFSMDLHDEPIPGDAVVIFVDFTPPTRSQLTVDRKAAFVFDTHDTSARVAATSAFVTLFLLALGFDVGDDKTVTTALYLGILKDTDFLTSHAVRDWDKAAFKILGAHVSVSALRSVLKADLPQRAIHIVGHACGNFVTKGARAIAFAGFTKPDEFNYVAEAADLILRAEGIDYVVVVALEEDEDGRLWLRYSVRTYTATADTSKLAKALQESLGFEGQGSAGGRYGFAGGYLPLSGLLTGIVEQARKDGNLRQLSEWLLRAVEMAFADEDASNTEE